MGGAGKAEWPGGEEGACGSPTDVGRSPEPPTS